MTLTMAKDDERALDEALAAFTDALLGEKTMTAERPPEADMIELLAKTITPEPPPDRLKVRVKRLIASEWPRKSRRKPGWRRFFTPRRRLALGLVAALLIVALAVAWWVPLGGGPIAGTAQGRPLSPITILLTFLVLFFVLPSFRVFVIIHEE